MLLRLTLAALCLATPLCADLASAIDDHILPGYQRFAQATAALDAAAETECTAPALRPAYHAAFDAWIDVAHLRFGPVEDEGRALAIAFWPDPRGITARSLTGLIADDDPVVKDPAAFATVSVAARGLMALDRLLFDDDLSSYNAGSYPCHLIQAIADDLARMAREIHTAWQDGHAALLRNAGEPDNTTYLAPQEAKRALLTALLSGLEFNTDQRLGRPLGTFERPRPRQAEAYRSDRPLRNVTLSLEALRDLATHLAGTPSRTLDAIDDALSEAKRLDDPRLAGVSEPQSRIRIESLQSRIREARETAAQEIGTALGVAAGFNAADGD
ncbi:imelysin family protein [uncultured Roseovarius sp.]|uniref:imelysin family protein n=1 Tax=uncultured Roseovarius sp. TaxID=293344 RepID=UPI0026100FDE|nr:imelysin family protein [uncultured Roseovarius sp.]